MSEGPLKGVRVLEFAGLGPAPFCGMLFADLGADVVRIDRPDGRYNDWDVITRGRRSVALNLKDPHAKEIALRLADKADALIEGFRPGVMERLGLGPDVVLQRKPSLVYGRMTGWGQTGPKANEAGHDINYIAYAGALHTIGSAEKPALPINYIGDFGGGALYLAFGVLAALMQARETGNGQVVDCAMLDGVVSLMAMIYGRLGAGVWNDRRDANTIDGGAHYYNVYECADGRFIAFGAVEAKFYNNLLDALGINGPDWHPQMDRARWPGLKARLTELMKTKPRDEWLDLLMRTETTASPVLSMHEAAQHPDNLARKVFQTIDGVLHPGVAPRFSESPDLTPGRIAKVGAHTQSALADWGIGAADIAKLES